MDPIQIKIDKKLTNINLENLEAMDPEEVFSWLDGVTDDQAENSDIGGDSDGEDFISKPSYRHNRSTASSTDLGNNEIFSQSQNIELDVSSPVLANRIQTEAIPSTSNDIGE